MEPAYKISRRKFLESALAAAAATGASVACGRAVSPWRFFTVEEARTLAAACDQIIPFDDDPGAAWAGVVNYIDRQLCGPFRHLRDSYRQGIAAIDNSSRVLYGSDFAVLPAVKQTELLTLLEHGQVPREAWERISSTEFFALLVEHTMQGFYGDPRHGGNRRGAGWNSVGLSYPPVRGRLKYDLTKP